MSIKKNYNYIGIKVFQIDLKRVEDGGEKMLGGSALAIMCIIFTIKLKNWNTDTIYIC